MVSMWGRVMGKGLMLIGIFLLQLPGTLLADSGQTVQEILGRTLESENVKDAHIYADGTFDGIYNGISYAGNWSLENGQFCREVTRGVASARNCLSLQPVRDEQGSIVAVDFIAPGVATRFELD